jgi:phage tail-like protein
MARSNKTDPVRNFKFQVQINPPSGSALSNLIGDAAKQMGFAVVSGLAVQNEMIAYREGGMNTHPHKMIGQSDFAPVTFSKGVFSNDASLYQWHRFVHSWSQGGLTSGGSTSGANDYRCDILVTVHDHPVTTGAYAVPNTNANGSLDIGNAKIGYKLFNCWPGSFALTDLNAGDSSIMIQQLVVNHEGFHIEFFGDEGVSGGAALSTLANLS